MLSKGSVAMLPFLLVGLIACHRRIGARDWARLLPFFIVSAGLTGVDIWFQGHGTEEIIRRAGFLERIAGAGAISWFYLGKALFPFDLVFCYPQWHLRADQLPGWLPLLGGLAAAVALWRFPSRGAHSIRLALAYFLVMLVPVMGFTDVYFMKYSLVADHYQHLAMLGVIGLAAAGWEEWRAAATASSISGPGAAVPMAAAMIVIALFGALTWRQCRIYRDRETLFRATLRRNPECWMAHNNLGLDLINAGRFSEALGHCQAAATLQPDLAEAHNNLGIALAGLGRLPPAIAQFQQALRLKPAYPEACNNLGNAFRLAGGLSDAIDAYRRALRMRPDYAEAHNNLGVAWMDLARWPEAIAQLQEAVRIAPGYTVARENLQLALGKAAASGGRGMVPP
jgi:protein O-mannosyl-transferase